MKTSLLAITCWMCCAAAVEGAERGFDEVVRAISSELHVRPMHIPFFGLAKFATFVVRPAGVRHIDLAVFEGLDPQQVSNRDIASAVRTASGDWLPFVQVRKPQETVLVYMTQEHGDCKLLVVAMQSGEVTVVELKLNPEAMQSWLHSPDQETVRAVSR
jgi:hypothetical protein